MGMSWPEAACGRFCWFLGNSQAPLHPVIGGGLGSFDVSLLGHLAQEFSVLV